MAGVDYDPMAGLQRLAEAAQMVHSEIAEIIAFHLAVEREVGIVIERAMRRPEHIKTLSHANKLKVLQACWRGPEEAADRLGDVLKRFNELRNAVAHGDDRDMIQAAVGRLRSAFDDLIPNETGEPRSIPEIAAGIVGFLADRPAPDPSQLYELVAQAATEVFGKDPKAAPTTKEV